jgi:hypothetical protein
MPMQMPMVFPLFIESEDFTSTLVLTNAADKSTYADVVLMAPNGGEITTRRVEFTPHSRRNVDVLSLLASVVSPVTTGSIAVIQSPEFDGSMVILGQLSLTYRASEQPSYVDEEIAMPNAEGSQVLRAIADSGEGSPLVSITNLSDAGRRITFQCVAKGDESFVKSESVGAGETLLTKACSARSADGGIKENLSSRKPENHHGPLGISLVTDGMPGSIAAFGLQSHRKGDHRFFTNVTFTDPKMLMSPSTVFDGVPVGHVSSLSEGRYIPELSLTNFSTNDIEVQVQYSQTTGESPSTYQLASLTIPAGSGKKLTFDALPGDPQLQNSFLVSSTGAPGDLLAKLVSRNDSGPNEVELLAKDAMDMNNGGSNPWSIEHGTESTLLFFNHDQAPQVFNVLVTSADGTQWNKDFNLSPMETKAISIRDIVEKQMKDDKGRILPKTALFGQISWWTVGTNSGPGTGRLLESNNISGTSRSFACGCPYILCGTQFFDTGVLTLEDTAAPLDSLTPLICLYKVNTHCSGASSSNSSSQALSYSWSSSNSAILQVSGSSTNRSVNVYGAGGGSANMTGHVSATYFQPPQTCTFQGSGGTTVQVPTYFFSPSAQQTATPPACTQQNFTGYFIDVSYYVADQNSSRISKSGMAPGENLNDGNGWHDAYATPATTRSDGSFDDTPFGACYGTTGHFCAAGPPQTFRLTTNGFVLPIATNTTNRKCTDGIQLVIQGNPSTPLPGQNKTYTFGNVQ